MNGNKNMIHEYQSIHKYLFKKEVIIMTKEIGIDVYIHHRFDMVGDYFVIPSIEHAQIEIHTYLKKYVNKTNREFSFDGFVEQGGEKRCFTFGALDVTG